MDTQQLIAHLTDTPAFIQRHRSQMTPGRTGYSDAPTFGGFRPKSPCNEHAMELGDMEAAFVGNLAKYCITMGTIPPHPLNSLWFIDGECKGIRTYNEDATLSPIHPLINHLKRYAEDIINTEGIDELLKAGEETRWYSKKMFPQEDPDWVTIEEAEKITGRTKKTIHGWRRQGWIENLDDNWGTMLSRAGLESLLAAFNAKRTSNLPKRNPVV